MFNTFNFNVDSDIFNNAAVVCLGVCCDPPVLHHD